MTVNCRNLCLLRLYSLLVIDSVLGQKVLENLSTILRQTVLLQWLSANILTVASGGEISEIFAALELEIVLVTTMVSTSCWIEVIVADMLEPYHLDGPCARLWINAKIKRSSEVI